MGGERGRLTAPLPDPGHDRLRERLRGRGALRLVPGRHALPLVVVQRAVDLAGIDHRHAHAAPLELVTQRLAEPALRRLRGTVDRCTGERADPRPGGHDGYLPATPGEHP